MQFKIQVIIDDEHGEVITEDIIVLDKSSEGEGLIGISLSESKQLLKRLQHVIVTQQANHYTQTHRNCPNCDKTAARLTISCAALSPMRTAAGSASDHSRNRRSGTSAPGWSETPLSTTTL